MTTPKEEILWSLKKKESGKVYSNIPFQTLRTWILEARIDPDDYISNSETQKWMPASAIEELKSFLTPEVSASDIISSSDMTMPWGNQEIEDAEVDFTSMIDMIFLLIIFFAVTATFVVHEVKSVQVPKSSQTSKYKQEKLAVYIDKDQKVYLGSEQIALQNLKDRLIKKIAQTGEQDVVVAADQTLNYGFVVSVLDEVNGAGIKNVKLKLEKKSK